MALLLLVPAGRSLANEPAPALELPPGITLWHALGDVQAGVGYKDNVTLASSGAQGGAFEQTYLDFMLFRLPWHNWQFSLLASGQDRRYFDPSLGVDTEQAAAASAELTWFPGRHWRSTTSLKYSYINQVMDVSALTGVLSREQFLGHSLSVGEAWRKDLGPWWLEAGAALSRSFYRQPLDSSWEVGPRLTAGRAYGQGSDVSLNYQLQEALFDTREQLDLDGAPVPGTRLRFQTHTLSLLGQHYWGPDRRWRNATQLSLALNHDNGSGYYDYLEPRVSDQLRYRVKGWEFSLNAAIAWYAYEHFPVSGDDPSALQRAILDCGVRVEKQLGKHWKIFAGYAYERSLSNAAAEQYQVNTGQAGLNYNF